MKVYLGYVSYVGEDEGGFQGRLLRKLVINRLGCQKEKGEGVGK